MSEKQDLEGSQLCRDIRVTHHDGSVECLELTWRSTGKNIIRDAISEHIVMTDGTRFLTTARRNPVNAYTMGGIVRDAGLTVDEFHRLL